jgi:hypothetical protein
LQYDKFLEAHRAEGSRVIQIDVSAEPAVRSRRMTIRCEWSH